MMTPEQFLEWRKSLGFTQAEAALRLGVSKRSIFTYEGAGPVPRTVALACAAITDEVQAPEFFERLVKEQHPKAGENLLVFPFVVEQGSAYRGVVEVGPSAEVREWMQDNTPSAQFSMRTVITPDMRRRDVAVVTFDNATEATLFKLRWH
jgi:DNA-binding XRE family transcriptional regulator